MRTSLTRCYPNQTNNNSNTHPSNEHITSTSDISEQRQ